MLKKLLKQLLPDKILRHLYEIKHRWGGYAVRAYSQEGEDMLLRRIFEARETGFYIDIGAHHPRRYSNTYSFYHRGWRGINIDAMPGSMIKFNKLRPRDINLEIALSDCRKKLTYYMFDEPALNGFSQELSDARLRQGKYRIISQVTMETMSLAEVLEKHLPRGERIDFLSIDVEGLDFKVLKSNDFSKYRPKVVLIEIIGQGLDEVTGHPITTFMRQQRYIPYAKTVYTVFFLEQDFYDNEFILNKSH